MASAQHAYKNGMPEGPEIRRSADRIAAAIDGQTLVEVHFGPQRLRPFEDELTGARVAGVETRGKALLIAFDLGLTLYAHNQLYGVWYVRRRGDLPHTARSLRVALHTDTNSALLYSASEIALLDADGLLRHPYLGRLGPDLLDPALHWRDLARRLNDPAFRNRSLAALYLDQGFIAGLGNYLRSETLFAAGLHPRQRPRDLDLKTRNRLARSTLEIGWRAYRGGGVTNPEALVAALKASGQRRRGYRFAVFGRDGQPCHVCGTTIERLEISGRRLYRCPGCQPSASRR
jgi:endonuclease-8